jgi:hypothetical protein
MFLSIKKENIMKKIIIPFTVLLVMLFSWVNAETKQVSFLMQEKLANEVINPYFTALREGNVNEIKKHLSEEMYEKNKVLFEQNKEYPAFLQKYYLGTEVSVERAEIIDGVTVVNVLIVFPNGNSSNSRLKLQKKRDKDGNEVWKIGKPVNE